MSRLLTFFAVFTLWALAALVRADPPATQPTHLSAGDGQITRWINQLGDDDPDVRQAAAQSLMSLQKSDLDRLHSLAANAGNLLPNQINSLRDVVKQVYLSGEKEPSSNSPFLGLYWPLPTPNQFQMLNPQPIEVVNANGLPVDVRMRGFPAYRFLRPGDLIVAVTNHPEIDTHSRQSFIEAMAMLKPGNIVDFEVSRGGKTIQVSIPLAARPLEVANVAGPDEWMQNREDRAEKYWDETFASLDPSSQPSTRE